ncbi:hypothetical protein HK101_010107 [Irineochytrium annulatum]|nr:hypothetical protein HK101_010107 [Irineochytrium annulatum]
MARTRAGHLFDTPSAIDLPPPCYDDAIKSKPLTTHDLVTQALRLQRATGASKADVRLGACLFREAADGGDAVGKVFLGVCYQHGRGVVRDEGRAVTLYGEAAADGSADAMYLLGKCWELGVGVERDMAEAERLYGLAAEKGNRQAMERVKKEAVPKASPPADPPLEQIPPRDPWVVLEGDDEHLYDDDLDDDTSSCSSAASNTAAAAGATSDGDAASPSSEVDPASTSGGQAVRKAPSSPNVTPTGLGRRARRRALRQQAMELKASRDREAVLAGGGSSTESGRTITRLGGTIPRSLLMATGNSSSAAAASSSDDEPAAGSAASSIHPILERMRREHRMGKKAGRFDFNEFGGNSRKAGGNGMKARRMNVRTGAFGIM